jgi:micrococcal nuclease
VPAALIAALGLGAGGGVAYSWQKVQAYRNEILHLQEFCNSLAISPTFATVERVIDGDTLKLKSGETVRLLGPDTPEICHHDSHGRLRDPECEDEFYGPEAKEFAQKLLEGEEVVLVGDPEVGDRDYFGRLLRYVYLRDRFINLELITEGYAPVYERLDKKSKFYEEMQEAERGAREEGVGVWANPSRRTDNVNNLLCLNRKYRLLFEKNTGDQFSRQ